MFIILSNKKNTEYNDRESIFNENLSKDYNIYHVIMNIINAINWYNRKYS